MNKKLGMGLDLGGTNVRAALVDFSGRVLALSRLELQGDRGIRTVLHQVKTVAEQALSQAGVDWARVAGMGLGVAAQLRGDSGVVAVAPNLGWREEPLGEHLAGEFGRRVVVVNDLDAIAWGESCCGAARDDQNVLVVYTGTGVGSGLVLAGALYQGATGVAGELGHVKVTSRADATCGCGSHGCLEAYLGGANLSRRLQREAGQDWHSLRDLVSGDLERIHPGLVEQLVKRGDNRAERLFDELAGYFGQALANAVTLLNLSAVVLGGSVLDGCPSLRERVVAVLKARVLAVAGEGLKILKPELGDQAGVVGAALIGLAKGKGEGA